MQDSQAKYTDGLSLVGESPIKALESMLPFLENGGPANELAARIDFALDLAPSIMAEASAADEANAAAGYPSAKAEKAAVIICNAAEHLAFMAEEHGLTEQREAAVDTLLTHAEKVVEANAQGHQYRSVLLVLIDEPKHPAYVAAKQALEDAQAEPVRPEEGEEVDAEEFAPA